ncbi:unnamed protein product [Macrosiphum euphorbiae]|uniref:ATP synthase F0 subunit 8 n=1 Tax=Macrosiphum euphorbiae TaxID=13131 RepID=A0AAV0WDS6_9HEMI|nr:unnamed protein product [Macrosiphum euphorbiae]
MLLVLVQLVVLSVIIWYLCFFMDTRIYLLQTFRVVKSTKDSEDIQTIDEMYPNDFKAIKDTSGVDFSGIRYNKLVSMEKNVEFTWLLSPEPKYIDFSDILKLDHFIHYEEFRVNILHYAILCHFFTLPHHSLLILCVRIN